MSTLRQKWRPGLGGPSSPREWALQVRILRKPETNYTAVPEKGASTSRGRRLISYRVTRGKRWK